MTCRGSRRNTIDKAKNIYEDSPEWLAQNHRSTRNFIRKWGHFVSHDELLKPIIPPKYDIGLVLKVNNIQLLRELEPWVSTVYCDTHLGNHYKITEQPETRMNLDERVKPYSSEKTNNVIIEFTTEVFNQDEMRQIFFYFQNLSNIIRDSGEIGQFELGRLKITINSLETFEKDLIICKK